MKLYLGLILLGILALGVFGYVIAQANAEDDCVTRCYIRFGQTPAGDRCAANC